MVHVLTLNLGSHNVVLEVAACQSIPVGIYKHPARCFAAPNRVQRKEEGCAAEEDLYRWPPR